MHCSSVFGLSSFAISHHLNMTEEYIFEGTCNQTYIQRSTGQKIKHLLQYLRVMAPRCDFWHICTHCSKSLLFISGEDLSPSKYFRREDERCVFRLISFFFYMAISTADLFSSSKYKKFCYALSLHCYYFTDIPFFKMYMLQVVWLYHLWHKQEHL